MMSAVSVGDVQFTDVGDVKFTATRLMSPMRSTGPTEAR